MAGVNWGLLQQPRNFADDLYTGMQRGEQMRTQRDTRNALQMYGQDPEGALNALITSGNLDAAAKLSTADKGVNALRARSAAKPFAAQGDYRGAAKAAGAHDPDFARMFSQMDADQLTKMEKLAEKSSSVLMAAANLPTPEARRAFVQSNAGFLREFGFSDEQLNQVLTQTRYDDPLWMRTEAAKSMDAAKLAGEMRVQKEGDYSTTYAIDPIRGARPVSRQEIPATRAERLQAQRFQADQAHREREYGYTERRIDLDQRRTEQDLENGPTMGRILGGIGQKVTNGQPLTEGEQEIWTRYTNGTIGDPLDEYLNRRLAGLLESEGKLPGESAAPGAGDGTTGGPPRRPGRQPPARTQAPAAPPPVSQRVVGKVYQSPNGPMKWTGQGWEPVR